MGLGRRSGKERPAAWPEAPLSFLALPLDAGTGPLPRTRLVTLAWMCALTAPRRLSPSPALTRARMLWPVGLWGTWSVCAPLSHTHKSWGRSVRETREIPAAQVHMCWCKNTGMHTYKVRFIFMDKTFILTYSCNGTCVSPISKCGPGMSHLLSFSSLLSSFFPFPIPTQTGKKTKRLGEAFVQISLLTFVLIFLQGRGVNAHLPAAEV